jgi:hypothetical protein
VRIVELPDMSDDYMEEGEGKPYVRLKARYEDTVNGEYECGLSNGMIDGAAREFGGEHIVVFCFEGADEMDMSNGGCNNAIHHPVLFAPLRTPFK